MADFVIKKGFDIRLEGQTRKIWEQAPRPGRIAVKPVDFKGIKPVLAVEAGDKVKSFTPLFTDKLRPSVRFTSPVSGTVTEIIRGEKRAVEAVVIRPDWKNSSENIRIPRLSQTSLPGRDKIISLLLESGLFAGFIRRPFGYTADPEETPRDIFISAFDSSPLAADWNYIVSEYSDYFRTGLKIISKLTPGRVHIAVNALDENLCDALKNSSDAMIHRFRGHHPAGNCGTHINRIAPIRGRDDIVWTCSPFQVVRIGYLFTEGIYPAETPVAVAGSSSLKEERVYYKAVQGSSIEGFIGKKISDTYVRYISGNVLTGRSIGHDGFIGFHDNLVTLIPEPYKPDFLGWALPGFNRLSASRSFISFFLKKHAGFAEKACLNGGRRAFMATGIYDDVVPLDIYPLFLIKSIIAGEIDEMEELGILDVIEEDLALCEYIDPSKNEWQEILRGGLDHVYNEG